MKILITGANGFIGSALVRKISHFDILGIDKNEINIGFEDPGILIKRYKPTTVIHLGAQIDVIESFKNPKYDLTVNALGTTQLVESAIKNNVKHFIYINSAGAIYKHVQNHETSENDNVNPQSPYGTSKLAGEMNLQILSANSEMQWSSLALSNVYGPYKHGRKGLINIIFENIKQSKKTIIYGKNITRDYVYISDVINAIELTINYPTNKRVHISSNIATSNYEVTENISKLLELNSKDYFEFVEARSNEQQFCKISNKLALQEIGWQPKYNLYQGLTEIIEKYE